MNPIPRTLPISELFLDPENPRLLNSLRNSSESEIIDFLLTEHSLIELMLAIGQNGYFQGEQLLVVQSDNGFKVVEGNRRLAAVKLLNNPELATKFRLKINQVLAETSERPTEVPCLVFENEQLILKYLGFRHITGTKEWRLLEKARYLTELWESEFRALSLLDASRAIAKSIGSKSDYVKRILIGFHLYKIVEDAGFYNIPELNDTNFYFNYIADSLNKENIKAFIGIVDEEPIPWVSLDEANLTTLMDWFFRKNDQLRSRVIGDSKNLTMLNAVLGDEVAKEHFEDGMELSRAYELTEGFEKIKNIRSRISNIIYGLKEVNHDLYFYDEIKDDFEKDLKSLERMVQNFNELIVFD